MNKKLLGGAHAEAKREEEARENCHLRDVGGGENYLIEFLCI
jgi:hypothetical protein